jgi:poly-gamma-glutamate synthesis protein (capsule biosynthesis protein)
MWGEIDLSLGQRVLSYVVRLPSVNDPVRILSTGDLMLGRSVNYKGAKGNDFGWSFQQVRGFLTKADYVVANLENPIITDCPLTNEGMVFCADEKAGEALKKSGINLLTLANNHILNYGQRGQEQTKQILTENGLDSLAEGESLTKVLAGKTFGFLAFDDVSNNLVIEEVATRVAKTSMEVDHLLVAVHFGNEYRYTPTQRQVELARAIIDAGARAVLGNHSHWLGAVELYQRGAIIYSHGNFVFDQMWSEETKEGILVSWEFGAKSLQQIMIYPVYITDYGKVNLAVGAKASKILKQVQKISNVGIIKDERLVIEVGE